MCECAKKFNETLKPMNIMLTRNMLEGDDAPVLIEINKIVSRKRSASLSLVATYCPFCGEKYPERKERGVLKSHAENAA